MFTDKMKKNKKSQAEIVGLVIIVLLITIGFLFVVKFVIMKEEPDTKKSFVYSELASNTLNVLLKTTTDCEGSDVTELFQDCAALHPRIFCGGVNSCDKVNEVVEYILNKSLKKWNKQYEFNAYIPGSDEPISYYNNNCDENLDKESSTYYILIFEGRTLHVTLDICG
ncbi:hypothetical protein COV14_02925 [Candidatus Woesearchaeota archaeon CG10_big_fil_rev_8_21_14_0_10_33_12]|nr:MAG: hypothetical protein COV14_02925 [Candidatus Woesearchaeota archaeon CG10_big_fil_rev_8_21_14_0_10_33_12]